jgi:hypothetical protein
MIRSKHLQKPAQLSSNPKNTLSKGGWSLGAEDLLASGLGDTVGQREAEALLEELADVGALDVLGLLDLGDTEDLKI